jgi:ureidoacrylate peracid hydrolase
LNFIFVNCNGTALRLKQKEFETMPYPLVLMVMDMQIDFIEPEGVYQRLGGLDPANVRAIVPNVKAIMEKAKTAKIPIIGTKFTVLAGLEGEAIGLGHLEQLRPFLKQAGFRQGSAGQQILVELPKPDYEIEKTRFNAFYSSPLEGLLKALAVKTLIFTGIASYGAVEATAREAIVRDYDVIILSDCCASFTPKLHDSAMTNLSALGTVTTSDRFSFDGEL